MIFFTLNFGFACLALLSKKVNKLLCNILLNTTKEDHPNQYLNSRDFKHQLFRPYYLETNLKLYHSMARANLNKVKYLKYILPQDQTTESATIKVQTQFYLK